jgi:hypothetical protein
MDAPAPRIRLYMDEDVHESVAPALRQHGYDVLTVREAGRRGLTDAGQLVYAAEQGRTLSSFNASDYVGLHQWSHRTPNKHDERTRQAR